MSVWRQRLPERPDRRVPHHEGSPKHPSDPYRHQGRFRSEFEGFKCKPTILIIPGNQNEQKTNSSFFVPVKKLHWRSLSEINFEKLECIASMFPLAKQSVLPCNLIWFVCDQGSCRCGDGKWLRYLAIIHALREAPGLSLAALHQRPQPRDEVWDKDQ